MTKKYFFTFPHMRYKLSIANQHYISNSNSSYKLVVVLRLKVPQLRYSTAIVLKLIILRYYLEERRSNSSYVVVVLGS